MKRSLTTTFRCFLVVVLLAGGIPSPVWADPEIKSDDSKTTLGSSDSSLSDVDDFNGSASVSEDADDAASAVEETDDAASSTEESDDLVSTTEDSKGSDIAGNAEDTEDKTDTLKDEPTETSVEAAQETSDAATDDKKKERSAEEENGIELQSDSTQDYSGIYVVRTKLSGSRALDVSGAATSSGANVQMYGENNTPAQRFSFSRNDDGYYTIKNVNSGKVLDVSGGSNTNGANVQQYSSNGTAAQRWAVVKNSDGSFTITSKLKLKSGASLVLDICGANSSNGANVQLYSSNKTAAQKWSLTKISKSLNNGVYVFKNSGSGKVLDVSGGSASNAANIQQYAANSTLAQRFSVTYDSNTGYYRINVVLSGKTVDVSGAGTANGVNVWQYQPNGSKAQKWSIVANSDGSYTLRSANSGKVLDVSGGSKANGANVQQYQSNGTAAQKWIATASSIDIPSGAYTFNCSYAPSKVLDVSGGSVTQGGNIQVYESNGTAAQKFYVSPYGSTGFYTIRNIGSGCYVGLAGGSTKSGANVDQGYKVGSPADSQLWKPSLANGGIVWTSKAGTVLDVRGGSFSNGANVQAYQGNNTAAQKWALQTTGAPSISNGIYSIAASANVAKVVDIAGGSTSSGANAQLYANNDTSAQLFYVTSVGGGYYTVCCLGSNKAMDVSGGKVSSAGQANVQQWDSNGSSAQKWKLSYTKDGFYTLIPQCATGSALDISGGSLLDGTNIQVHKSNGSSAQKFVLQNRSSSVSYFNMNMSLSTQAGYQDTRYHSYSEYYNAMNPSSSGSMTRFADIRGYTGLNAASLNRFISSTSTGRSGNLVGTGQYWVDAAKQYGVNEAYILSHALLESGWGTSTLAKGYYYSGGWIDGKYYNAGTYYNYFGIGAYDSSPLSGGRKYAIINGWNSREKAIKGGTAWIASNYIYRSDGYSQVTLYELRYDLARSNATYARGWHQYCTSLTWVNSIATLTDNCYSQAGVSPSFSYRIPRYR